MARVLRHLKHMEPRPKGPGGKFASRTTSFARSNPRFVQPKDRIAYWNIAPGDEVRVTVGGIKQVDPVTGKKTVLPYEGVVNTVDRERNLVYLRASEGDKDDSRVPKNLKHTGSSIRDAEKGVEGGYTPNTAYQVRPVHYSNLQLKLPENTPIPDVIKEELGMDLKKGYYVDKLQRTGVAYSARYGHFIWKRYFTVLTASGPQKIIVPWKSIEARDKVRKQHASGMHAVDEESWIPWDPRDPFKLLAPKRGTSEQALHRVEKSILQRMQSQVENAEKAKAVDVAAASGRYAGFSKGKHVRMPLIPQAPTASEQLHQARQEVAEWLKHEDVNKHNAQGRRTFTALDYIESTPIEGPLDAQWHTVAAGEQSDEAWTRDATSGKLKQKVSRRDMDSWPVELLMVNDLTNPTGLRNRMRAWNRKQAEKLELLASKKVEEEEKVQLLRDWVAREEVSMEEKKSRAATGIDALLANASIRSEARKMEADPSKDEG